MIHFNAWEKDANIKRIDSATNAAQAKSDTALDAIPSKLGNAIATLQANASPEMQNAIDLLSNHVNGTNDAVIDEQATAQALNGSSARPVGGIGFDSNGQMILE